MKTTYSTNKQALLNIDDLIKDFQVKDATAFSGYLLEMWKVKKDLLN